MAETRELLVEIGTEELPPTALPRLIESFHREVLAGLERQDLKPEQHQAFAAPRRLAVLLRGLPVKQPDRVVNRRGPALQAAFDDSGEPTKAALGFARSCGVNVADLGEERTEKGAWLSYQAEQPGQDTSALVPEIVQHALNRLPIPRRMRWGDSDAAFVRPVHWICALFGDTVVPIRLFGIASDRLTRGHRFHTAEPIPLQQATDYEAVLEQKGFVLAGFERRRQRVREQVEAEAERVGGRAVIEDSLLDEVTALVEWPVAITGRFDARFLDVPSEALVSSMQGHQKYFPLRDAGGRLMPAFITVANLESRDPEQVVLGNERVIRPRLADAEFFWNQDRRKPLAERVPALREIIFQKRLGSLHDKAVRVAALARLLAPAFGSDADRVEQAAMLAKCDLLTEMVGEFPELQGTMGRYYALHDGLDGELAGSLEQHYLPRYAGDRLPETALAQALAVAERADTLVGIFALGQIPSGDKDPFALRRAALGLMRILVECKHSLSLRRLFRQAHDHLPQDLHDPAVIDDLVAFCLERLRGYMLDRGVSSDVFDAASAARAMEDDGAAVDDPVDLAFRLEACAHFRKTEAAASLAAANKRVQNILRKAEQSLPAPEPDPAHFDAEEEKLLYQNLQRVKTEIQALNQARRYQDSLSTMAQLREPVDAFFDSVMVMADDPAIRRNRLHLLGQLAGILSSVADIARLTPEQAPA
ncbi:glycine--tRNA ligase subunit beta [Methylonatrum kenyense]|uniref:glycine--tRNA ligase subunit beta n=1 Tax=Methylonatrum kenyense TaxID=455253 RepID=UPI0020BE23F2|nr:glycine--tRNA ligase subunit beta [Methylonatrum kenyense]MCK8515265.1 glycine--tRNA ligase subunit beta [Methylonatrum kenyense]